MGSGKPVRCLCGQEELERLPGFDVNLRDGPLDVTRPCDQHAAEREPPAMPAAVRRVKRGALGLVNSMESRRGGAAVHPHGSMITPELP